MPACVPVTTAGHVAKPAEAVWQKATQEMSTGGYGSLGAADVTSCRGGLQLARPP